MKVLERPKSLTELVTSEIRNLIVSGELELGSSLSEARIAKDLDVSRTPVREAINRLEMEGLLHTEPQRGTYVFSLEPDELGKICDVRVCLETTALRTAFSTNKDELVERISACTNRMRAARKSGDDQEYLREDTNFHQIILDCSDNRFLRDAYLTIATKMAALRNRLGRHPDHMAKSFDEHVRIYQALNSDDLPQALQILEYHIGRKEGSYWTHASSAA